MLKMVMNSSDLGTKVGLRGLVIERDSALWEVFRKDLYGNYYP